jgi:hypothetical protein
MIPDLSQLSIIDAPKHSMHDELYTSSSRKAVRRTESAAAASNGAVPPSYDGSRAAIRDFDTSPEHLKILAVLAYTYQVDRAIKPFMRNPSKTPIQHLRDYVAEYRRRPFTEGTGFSMSTMQLVMMFMNKQMLRETLQKISGVNLLAELAEWVPLLHSLETGEWEMQTNDAVDNAIGILHSNTIEGKTCYSPYEPATEEYDNDYVEPRQSIFQSICDSDVEQLFNDAIVEMIEAMNQVYIPLKMYGEHEDCASMLPIPTSVVDTDNLQVVRFKGLDEYESIDNVDFSELGKAPVSCSASIQVAKGFMVEDESCCVAVFVLDPDVPVVEVNLFLGSQNTALLKFDYECETIIAPGCKYTIFSDLDYVPSKAFDEITKAGWGFMPDSMFKFWRVSKM